MLDFQTIFIYISLFLIMYFLAYKAKNKLRWGYIVVAILIYSLVFGMRYNVGDDYLAYFESYKNISASSYNVINYRFEPGFIYIILFMTSINAHFTWFFGVIAFLQLYLIFSSVKSYREIYPFLVFTFMIGCVWLTYANGLRQQLAFCLFAFAISFIERSKWWWYYLIILFAITMHKTAVLLIILYPLLKYKMDWFQNRINQLGLLLSAIIIGNIGVVQNYISQLETYAVYLGYEDYFLDQYAEILYKAIERKGIGYYVLLMTNIILIWLSTNSKLYFNCKYLYYIYNLYFIGVLMNYAFAGSQLLQRGNYYFYGFAFIIGAFTLLYAKKKNKKMYLTLMTMYLLTFIATMYRMEDNASLFRFFWQI